MPQTFESALAQIPGMGGYLAKQRFNEQSAHADMQEGVGAISILDHIKKQQEAVQLRDAVTKGDMAALMKIPGGIDIMGKLVKQQHEGVTADLQRAQLAEIQRKGAITNTQQQYASALIPQMTQSQYKGETSPESTVSPQVMSVNDGAADQLAIQAERENQARIAAGQPPTVIRIDNNNPNVTKALVAGAGSALPARTGAEILKGINPPSLNTLGSQVRPVAGGYLERQPDGSAKFVPTATSKAADTAANAGMAGVGMMNPETLKFNAQRILAGDRQAGVGYAKSAPLKTALENAVAAEAKAQGITGTDLARIMSEYAGFTAGQRTLGTRQANIELAAQVTNQFAPLAVSASEAFDRTPFKSLNDIEKAVLSRTASPELRKFNFANTSLINAYARAINPNGVGTVSDKDHAREILETGFSKGDYKAAVDQLQMEIDAELKAPGAVKAGMKEFFGGKQPVSTESVTSPARRSSDKPGAVKTYNPATGKIE